MDNLQNIIESVWNHRLLLEEQRYKDAVNECISLLNNGLIRVVNKDEHDAYIVNDWVKKAILLYFIICKNKDIVSGDIVFYDKIALKSDYEAMQVRAVPPAVARYGAYIAPSVVLMPSFVNIGAYVDTGTMVDTWATVGSCAQIGKNVHLSGGVGIGGVLEPIQAQPVIIEDHCFIGSRCIIVEGVRVEHDCVLGANTVITGSTPIIDVTNETPTTYKGVVPANSIVIPGNREKEFKAGKYQIPCALIIGKRNENTDKKVSLNSALRMIN